MMDNGKDFSTFFFAMTTLLICCNPTSSFANQTAMPTLNKGWSYFLEHLIPASGTPLENSAIGQRVMKQNSIPIFGPLVPNDGPVNPPTRATENPSTQAPELPSSTPFPSLICGRGPPMPARSLISERVGGTDSSLATTPWPFLVNLKRNFDPPGVFFCSGSLISDQIVLLAAKCFLKMGVFGTSGVTVWIGQSNQDGPLTPLMTRTISKYVTHDRFFPFLYTNDIALILLDSPVIFSRNVSAVCLPPVNLNGYDQYDGRDAAIMGWGPETQGAPSTALRQGKVKIGKLATCMANMNIPSVFFSTQNICIIPDGSLPNKFTCMADMGGPVVINTAPSAARPEWTQVGINSLTANCASFGMKTRVSAFSDWIGQEMINLILG